MLKAFHPKQSNEDSREITTGTKNSPAHKNETETICSKARERYKNALLVWPELPKSHWSFHYSLKMVDKCSLMPPLGLITMAADLPKTWDLTLADLNTGPLSDEDISKTDVVLVGAMRNQRKAFAKILNRVHARKKPIIAGGTYVTTASEEEIPKVDNLYVFKGEMEERLPQFIELFEKGEEPRVLNHMFNDELTDFPDITKSPIPRYDLLNADDYFMFPTQFSRGCPHNCEFCDVTKMLGKRPRTKTPIQQVSELDAIYNTGFRGNVMFTDDNINGNPRDFDALLDELIQWQEKRDYPFLFNSQTTLLTARKKELLKKMRKAGFNAVFLGIETPSKKSLKSMNKDHNLKMDPIQATEEFSRHGIEANAGLIVGSDGDDSDCFREQFDFLQRSPIAIAMTGILLAMPNTDFWKRLEREGRIYGDCEGDFSHFPNFQTKLPEQEVVDGYKWLIENIYKPRNYFTRALRAIELLREATPIKSKRSLGADLMACVNSIWTQGIRSDYKYEYWRYLFKSLRLSPRDFTDIISFALRAHHMIEHTRKDVLPRLSQPIPKRELRRSVANDKACLTKIDNVQSEQNVEF